jgi:hypothetical protein
VDHYTILPNDIIQNDALSWAARGMLAYLLSLPPDWRLKTTDLIRRGQEGKARFYRIKAELEAAGFLRGTVSRTPQGVIAEWVWEVTDEAHCWPDSGKSESGETPVGSPDSGFPEGGKPRRWETQKVGFPEGGKPGNYKEHIDKELSDKEHTHKGDPDPGACVEESPAAQSEPAEPLTHFDPVALRYTRLAWEVKIHQPDPGFIDYVVTTLPKKENPHEAKAAADGFVRNARTSETTFHKIAARWEAYHAQKQQQQAQATDEDIYAAIAARRRRTGL